MEHASDSPPSIDNTHDDHHDGLDPFIHPSPQSEASLTEHYPVPIELTLTEAVIHPDSDGEDDGDYGDGYYYYNDECSADSDNWSSPSMGTILEVDEEGEVSSILLDEGAMECDDEDYVKVSESDILPEVASLTDSSSTPLSLQEFESVFGAEFVASVMKTLEEHPLELDGDVDCSRDYSDWFTASSQGS